MTSPDCARHADAVHMDAGARASVRVGTVIELSVPGEPATISFTVVRAVEETGGRHCARQHERIPWAYLTPAYEDATWAVYWMPCGAVGYETSRLTGGGSGGLATKLRVVAEQAALL